MQGKLLIVMLFDFFVEKIDTVNDTVKASLSSQDKAVLRLIAENNSITYDELALAMDKSRSTVYRVIKSLMARGLLVRHGSDKSGSWIIRD